MAILIFEVVGMGASCLAHKMVPTICQSDFVFNLQILFLMFLFIKKKYLTPSNKSLQEFKKIY